EIAPAMMGFEGQRSYLVLALNNGEILPGGGLVTAAGILSIDGGRFGGDINFEDSTQWLAHWDAQDGGYIEPPGPLRRYLLQQYPWNIAVVNWSPDFSTWSRQALEFFEMVHGPQNADGAMAMDLEVAKRLLQLTGPITLPVEG